MQCDQSDKGLREQIRPRRGSDRLHDQTEGIAQVTNRLMRSHSRPTSSALRPDSLQAVDDRPAIGGIGEASLHEPGLLISIADTPSKNSRRNASIWGGSFVSSSALVISCSHRSLAAVSTGK